MTLQVSLGRGMRKQVRAGVELLEFSIGGQAEDGSEFEESDAELMHEAERGGINKGGGWGEQDKGMGDSCGKVDEGVEKLGSAELEGEDHGGRLRGPAADLECSRAVEASELWCAIQRLADGVAKPGGVEFERGNFLQR